MATARRMTYEDAVHYLFVGVIGAQATFRDDLDRKRYLRSLRKALDLTGCILYCYVLMDSHVHMVLRTPRANVTELMRRLQTSYAMCFNRRHDRQGSVFQGRYRSTLVEENNYLLGLSRAVHLTPVRAGVVARPEDYRWSSYHQYLGPRNEGEVDPDPVLAHCQGSAEIYRRFVEKGIEGSRQGQYSVSRQSFLGSPDFVREMKRRFSPEAGGATEGDVEHLLGELARQFGLGSLDAARNGKTRLAQQVRQYAMYVARLRWNMRLRVIGEVCGGLNHATVSHGVQVAEKRLRANLELTDLLEHLAKRIWAEQEGDFHKS